MRKHVLAQKANRSRRYGRIGSVSQQQTSTPRIIKVAAHYPAINQTDILHTEKEGTLRGLRQQPLVRLKVTSLPSQPFYLYGSFHDGRTAYLSFFKRVVDSDLDFTFNMPSFAQSPKIHASLTPPPAHFSHQYISEAKSQWVRSRSLLASEEEFFSLGFVPATPRLWEKNSTMPEREGSDTLRYWSGRKSDFDPRIHGAGPHNMGNFTTDIYGGTKGILPMGHAARNQNQHPSQEFMGPIYWFVFCEYVEGKGWLVLNDDQPTFKAGHPYCIMGAMYVPKNQDFTFGTEYKPAEDYPAPKFDFLSAGFVDEFGPARKNQSAIDDLGWKIQPYFKGINGGYWPTDAYVAQDYTEGLSVSVADLYNDNGAGWFWDSLGKGGERLRDLMAAAGVPPSSKKVIDTFAVDLEYWDFGSNRWGSRPNRTCDSEGRFAWYFRGKRQLHKTHPDYSTQPDWQEEKSANAYPMIRQLGDGSFNVGQTHIGFRQVRSGGFRYNESPFFRLAVRLDVYSTMRQHNSRLATLPTGYSARFADPDNFAYSTNQQIDRVFFEDGQFAPGKKVVMIGKGLDAVNGILVSRQKSLAALARQKGVATPRDLVSDAIAEQYYTKKGTVNQESIGYLRPLSVVTSEDFQKALPPAFTAIYQKLFGGIPSTDLFSSFLDNDVKVAGYMKQELENLPLDISTPLIDKVAVRYGPLDNTDKNGRPVRQMREKPTHFKLEHDGGVYEFPFSIGIFEVPAGYSGPAPVIVARKGGKIIPFDDAKRMMVEAALSQEVSALGGFSGLGDVSSLATAVEEKMQEALDAWNDGTIASKFPKSSARSVGTRDVYSIHRETVTAPDNAVPSTVHMLWDISPSAHVKILVETTTGPQNVEASKEWEIQNPAWMTKYNAKKGVITKYFNDEVARVAGTNRAPKELSSEREILEQMKVNNRIVVLAKISATGGIHGEKTVVYYEVSILDSGRAEASTPQQFSDRKQADARFNSLTGAKKLIQDLEFIHDPNTPETVYYRYRNVLGEATTGFEEDLSAEIQLQLAKENYGLSNLEQLLTDPVSVGGEEDVSVYDDSEQTDAEFDEADRKSGESVPPFFQFSMPKIFRTFKTDNLLRKHTLLPYGSRTPIEDDPTE